jgi:hypothetical protein
MAQDMTKRSGWITFAGVMAVIAGGYNALSGIAALSDDDTLAVQAKDVLVRVPAVGDSGPDHRLPGALRAADTERRLPGLTRRRR